MTSPGSVPSKVMSLPGCRFVYCWHPPMSESVEDSDSLLAVVTAVREGPQGFSVRTPSK